MAITYVGNGAGTQGLSSGATNFNFGAAVNAKDALVLAFRGSGGNPGTVSVSDTTNGAWTTIYNQYDATNGGIGAFFVQTSAVASPGPAISVTCASNPSVYATVEQFTGYLGVATLDPTPAGAYVSQTTAQASMTIAAASHFNNELLFLDMYLTQFLTTDPPTGWTGLISGTYYYSVQAAPANIGLSAAPFSAASTYNAITFGIYDAPVYVPVVSSLNPFGLGPG